MDKDVRHQGVFFALQQPANIADPYPFYDRLRTDSPFYWDFLQPGWFLTRYADVASALVDPRLSTENFAFDVSQLPVYLQEGLAPLDRIRKREALYKDSPEHDRLRRPLNRAFNPSSFEALRPGVASYAQQLLEEAEERSLVDLVRGYAEPLADYIMCELLGLPGEDREDFVGWCDQLRDFVTAPRLGRETVWKAEMAVKSIAAVQNYVGRIMADRQKKGADDLIGRCLAVEPNETPPTLDEVMANCVFFLHAGVRNTSAAIANAILALLRHPGEFDRLRESPQSIALAVEELLRYDTPLHVAIRGVREEVEFAGHRFRPDQMLILLLGAANRDPEQFPHPNQLDLTRRPNRHLSFGLGAHGCIGAWLARFGLTIALEAMIERKSRLRLTEEELEWNFPAMRRTVLALPVVVRPQASEMSGSRAVVERGLSANTARVVPF